MCAYIDKLLRKIGLSYSEWERRGWGASRIVADINNPKRQMVWVTDNFETASGYAKRSPELAWDALLDAIDHVLWIRRWRSSNLLKLCGQRNKWIDELLEGEPKVLTFTLETGGFNYPVEYVPQDRILNVTPAAILPS
jgi:hypothetical protein